MFPIVVKNNTIAGYASFGFENSTLSCLNNKPRLWIKGLRKLLVHNNFTAVFTGYAPRRTAQKPGRCTVTCAVAAGR